MANTTYDWTTISTTNHLDTYTITTTSPLYTGSNGIDWSNSTITANTSQNTLEVRGDANIDGDLKVKGKSINDSLERIEERLAILHPNEELEAKWENLRGLRKAYMELEAEIKEKEKVWGILKK